MTGFSHFGLRKADGCDFRCREDVGCDVAQLQRHNRVAEGVPHGDPALHGGNRSQRKHRRAVTGRVDAGNRGARNPVDDNVPGLFDCDPDLFQSEVVGVRDRADCHKAVGALDLATVSEFHRHAVAVTSDRSCARTAEHVHTATAQSILKHFGGVFVLARKNLVTRGHEGHFAAECLVGRGELGTRHTGADNHEVLGQFVKVVQLLPGEDPLAVRLGGIEFARVRADGDENGVGLELVFRAIRLGHIDKIRAGQAAAALDDFDARFVQALLDV